MKREIQFNAAERVAVGAISWKLQKLIAEAQRDYEGSVTTILRERGLEAIPRGAALVPGPGGFIGLVWDDGAPGAPPPAASALPPTAAAQDGGGPAKATASTAT